MRRRRQRGGSVGRGERDTVARGALLHEAAQAVAGDHGRAVEAVRAALKPIHDAAVSRELDAIPVARLQDVTEGRLRLGSVEKSGLRTLGSVLEAGPYRLRQIPGVGQRTVDQILAAARRLSERCTRLLPSTSTWTGRNRAPPRSSWPCTYWWRPARTPGVRSTRPRPCRNGSARYSPTRGPPPAVSGCSWPGGRRRHVPLTAVTEIRSLVDEAERAGLPELLAQASVDLLRWSSSDIAAWVDFELRSAEYYSVLAEISGRPPDTAAAEGFLPDEIAERVRTQHSTTRTGGSHYAVIRRSARGSSLAQRKVILGDEMGLGKTIQAIAVLAHLAAEGQSHFMVVCPASVLVNWTGRSRPAGPSCHGAPRPRPALRVRRLERAGRSRGDHVRRTARVSGAGWRGGRTARRRRSSLREEPEGQAVPVGRPVDGAL